MKKLLFALLLCGAAGLAYAGSTTVGYTPGTIVNFGATTDGGGNLYGNIAIVDGAAAANKAAVKAASTPPVAADPALVVALSPNVPYTQITISAAGTTAAATATLPGASTKTTYLCGWSIDADATAATVVSATITGIVTGTMTRRQGVAAAASGTASTWQTYAPCLPASAVNTAIAVVSGAAGAAGNTTVNAWGYQQ